MRTLIELPDGDQDGELPYTKDEIVMLVKLLKINNGLLSVALHSAVKGDMLPLDFDDVDEVLYCLQLLENIKRTMDGESDVWLADEIETEQWVKDASED